MLGNLKVKMSLEYPTFETAFESGLDASSIQVRILVASIGGAYKASDRAQGLHGYELAVSNRRTKQGGGSGTNFGNAFRGKTQCTISMQKHAQILHLLSRLQEGFFQVDSYPKQIKQFF